MRYIGYLRLKTMISNKDFRRIKTGGVNANIVSKSFPKGPMKEARIEYYVKSSQFHDIINRKPTIAPYMGHNQKSLFKLVLLDYQDAWFLAWQIRIDILQVKIHFCLFFGKPQNLSVGRKLNRIFEVCYGKYFNQLPALITNYRIRCYEK